jgi:maltooligosyltrehalose trehalohydrolase
MVALHRDLIRLRRTDATFSTAARERVHGAVIGDDAFVLRFFGPEGDRVLVVNLGHDLALASIAEPLLAPPFGRRWRMLWSSEDLRYGGDGSGPIESQQGSRFPGQAAIVLEPEAST